MHPYQPIRAPARRQPGRRRLVHWGSQPHQHDREGTRRARVCPEQAGNTVVMASTGERQPKPNRACPWNTFRALARVIFGSNARFYMRSEAARGAVMLAVSGPEWAPQDADGQNFSELEL